MPTTYTAPGGPYSRLYADMANQINLLIGGRIGSGKSTVIDGILHAILHDTPAADRLILIDLKKVELVEYRDLPHVVTYADDATSAIQALQTALMITNARYAEMQPRRLKEYNGSHLYIIIDELADMLTDNAIKKPAAELLQRIAQIGRGARVHIIAGTQHIPTVPTSIRCNFDSRLGLRTSTPQDSRNIIFRTGAEKLPNPRIEHRALGYYLTDGDPILYELPMVPDAERRRIIDHWTRQTA